MRNHCRNAMKRILYAVLFTLASTEGWHNPLMNANHEQIVIRDNALEYRKVTYTSISNLAMASESDIANSPSAEPDTRPILVTLYNKIAWPMQEYFDQDYFDLDSVEIDEEELKCLATTIYFESRNESYTGQVAIAKVVLNRVNNDSHKNTICGVMKERGAKDKNGGFNGCQFSWYCDGNSDEMKNEQQRRKAMYIARRMMIDPNYFDSRIPMITDGVEWFRAVKCPGCTWHENKLIRVAQIGGHYFYEDHK